MLKFRLGLLFLLLLGLVAGCRSSSQTPGRITGRVTYNGQPVKAGNITFHSEDKGSYNSSLSLDGSYEVTDLPTGPMIVTVENANFNPDKKIPAYPGKGGKGKGAAMDAERMAAEVRPGAGGPMTKEEMAARYVKIPAKYADPKKSDLTITITNGKQSKDFELTD
jgi:hypothetical protein